MLLGGRSALPLDGKVSGAIVMSPPILCSTHGNTATILVCDHIADAVRLKNAMPPFNRVNVDAGVFEVFNFVCLDCMDRFRLNDVVTISPEGEMHESSFPKSCPVCAKCFEAQLVTHHHAV